MHGGVLRARLACGLAVVFSGLLAACSAPPQGESTDEEGSSDLGTSTEALAPAGSNAQLVGNTIPTTMFPGERRYVTVTMSNNGVASPVNDWTKASPPYALSAVTADFNWAYSYVPNNVAVGAQNTFGFVVTAPPASKAFQARMSAVGLGTFGNTLSVPVTVDPAATPQWGCSLVSSTLPAQLAPGENRYITVTVKNTGSATWPATGLKLASRDTPANLWGVTNADLTTSVAPGGTASFAFNLKAPATPGTYVFQRDMKDYNGIGDFRTWNLCVAQNVVVGGMNALSAAVISQDFVNTTLRPGQQEVVHVTMQNTGSETWATGGTYVLYSLNTPVNAWGATLFNVPAATVSGANASFTLTLKAPTAPGSYHQKWQMRKVSGQGAGFFGPIIDVPVTVPVLQQLDSELVSKSGPAEMIIGSSSTVTVVLKNTGVEGWQSYGNYKLTKIDGGGASGDSYLTTNTPGGQNGTVTLYMYAGTTPGDYVQKWRMVKSDGSTSTPFGATVEIPIKVKLPDAPVRDATLSSTLPTTAFVGQRIAGTVYAKNTGQEVWAADGTYALYSQNQPVDLYGPSVQVPVTGYAVVYNNLAYLDIDVTAPSAPGSYHQKWQMRKLSGEGAGFFGPVLDVPLTVSAVSSDKHLVTINVGYCPFGNNGGMYGRTYQWTEPYETKDFSCNANSTCAVEVGEGDEFELWCDGSFSYDPIYSISPQPPNQPTPLGACRYDAQPGWPPSLHCDVFNVDQSYTVNLDWQYRPCDPDFGCF